MIVNSITLDIRNFNINPVVTVKAANQNANTIQATIKNNGLAYDLTNKSVRVYIKKTDTIIFNDVTIMDALNGIVNVDLTTQALLDAGTFQAELSIYEQDIVIATNIFRIEILETIRNDNAIESTNEFTALTNALNKVQDIIDNGIPNGGVNVDLSEYAKKSDLPDLTNYATKNELPDLTNYAKLTDIPNTSNFATKSEIPNISGYAKLTDIPSLVDYAKLTDIPTDYYNKTYIDNMQNDIITALTNIKNALS